MPKLYDKATFERNATLYRIMGHPKRLAILNLLRHGTYSVQEIARHLKLPQANLSQHLAMLRHHHLVFVDRRKNHVYYRLVHPKLVEACRILKEVWEDHIKLLTS